MKFTKRTYLYPIENFNKLKSIFVAIELSRVRLYEKDLFNVSLIVRLTQSLYLNLRLTLSPFVQFVSALKSILTWLLATVLLSIVSLIVLTLSCTMKVSRLSNKVSFVLFPLLTTLSLPQLIIKPARRIIMKNAAAYVYARLLKIFGFAISLNVYFLKITDFIKNITMYYLRDNRGALSAIYI